MRPSADCPDDALPCRPTPATLALLALILGLHVACYALVLPNFDHDYDAPHYARLAHEIRTGAFELAPHTFSNRLGVTVPVALLYAFGVSPLTTTLWPLTASLSTIALVFAVALRWFGARAALLAALLLATDTVQIRNAARLLPDLVVALFMLAGVAIVAWARATAVARRQRMLGVVGAAVLLAGLLAKETVVWTGPFLLAVLGLDVWHRRHAVFWRWFVGAGIVAGALFTGGYWLATGDPLYRLAGVEGSHNIRDWTFVHKGATAFLHRLTDEPAAFLVAHWGYGVLLVLALPALLALLRPRDVLPRAVRYWAGYAAVVLVSFWLGTTSLRGYNPLPLVERFLMPLLAPLAIAGAVAFTAVLAAEPRMRRSAVALLAFGFVGCAAAAAAGGLGRAAPYAAFALLVPVLAWPAPPRLHAARRALATALLVCLCVGGAGWYVREARGESDLQIVALERAVVAQQLRGLREPTVVFTDAHSVFQLPFYFPNGIPAQLRLVRFDEAPPEAETSRKLVYVHEPRLLALQLNWDHPMPAFARTPPDGWKRLAARSLDDEHWISLFEIASLDELRDAK